MGYPVMLKATVVGGKGMRRLESGRFESMGSRQESAAAFGTMVCTWKIESKNLDIENSVVGDAYGKA
jgi:acetyl/propionyl-CoA carboxylase alpha subunit